MSSAAWAEYLGQNCKPTPNGNFLLKKQVKGLCLGIISIKLWFVGSIILFGYFGSTVNLVGKEGKPHDYVFCLFFMLNNSYAIFSC